MPIFHRRFSIAAACGLAAVCLASLCVAQEVWTITTSDFVSRRAAVVQIDSSGLKLRETDGQQTSAPWSTVVDLSRVENPGGVPGGSWVLLATDGDRLLGEPVRLEGESVIWSGPLGEMAFPLSEVRAIARGEMLPDLLERPAAAQDSLAFTNGDRIEGVLNSLSPTGAELSSFAGEISWDNVAYIQFAAAPAAAGGRAGFRVRLAGGSVVTVRGIGLAENGSDVEMQGFDGVARRRPVGAVETIEQVNGPVCWLPDLPPTVVEHQPYFAEDSRPPRMNLSLDGKPITDGDRLARRGIGMASRSKVSWPLDGSYTTFRGKFAIDGVRPYANVTVRVSLDDKIAFELPDVTAATPVQVVRLPLGNARQITLEVDYGKTYDVQDVVNWIDPALIRDVPATPGR